ncbi:hypothetical protein R3P38DRAFT_3257527 [Favolaschia claudopus]|uniref:F-box domain-containing protein n=1 Tax=Favolaschia claudopus TaxID=2862362 RepID=A0AAW0DCW2_9AGAR
MAQYSSIPQLQEHIDALSSAIEAHERAVRDLRKRRSEARHTLNRFLDPMARLPLEIQSHIFLSVDLDSEPPKPDPNAPPMVLTNVCRLWRNIALATPKLWHKLLMDLPRRPQYAELCELWLGRALSYPLSLQLRGSLRLDDGVQDLVTTHGDQLENLSFMAVSPYSLDAPCMMLDLDESFPLLSLKTLSFEADEAANFSTMSDWLDVLRVAPALSSLTMCNMLFDLWDDREPLGFLTLPSLEVLHVGQPFRWMLSREHGSSALVLRYLTLPALKTLSVSEIDITEQDFVSFLSRSSPSLEEFHLTLPYEWPLSTGLLRFVSSLSFFELSSSTTIAFLPFIEVLSTSDILPNLLALVLNSTGHLDIADYGDILSMLTFRWTSCPTRLESFALNLASREARADHTQDLPAAEVRAAMRRLVDDGLKIHIGPRSENLL